MSYLAVTSNLPVTLLKLGFQLIKHRSSIFFGTSGAVADSPCSTVSVFSM